MQPLSGSSPLGLATTFSCLRFETSLFVASYDSQGYGGGIRTRLHTGGTSFVSQSQRVRVTLRLTVSQSFCLGVEPRLGLMTRYYVGESNENRKTEIKIWNIAPLPYKLSDMLPMLWRVSYRWYPNPRSSGRSHLQGRLYWLYFGTNEAYSWSTIRLISRSLEESSSTCSQIKATWTFD
jgi:hypothetical protein